MQYVELAFTMYEGYYYYAAVLLSITLVSGFVSTSSAHRKRLQLYSTVAHHRMLPVVQGGRVRYTHYCSACYRQLQFCV